MSNAATSSPSICSADPTESNGTHSLFILYNVNSSGALRAGRLGTKDTEIQTQVCPHVAHSLAGRWRHQQAVGSPNVGRSPEAQRAEPDQDLTSMLVRLEPVRAAGAVRPVTLFHSEESEAQKVAQGHQASRWPGREEDSDCPTPSHCPFTPPGCGCGH